MILNPRWPGLRGFFAFGAMAIETALPAMGRSSLDVAGFLWCARLIGRVHMGSDLRRFIVATSYPMHVLVNYRQD